MSCLLTDAYKESLNPVYSKEDGQISKDFISDIKSAVSKDLSMFLCQGNTLENAALLHVLTSLFVSLKQGSLKI